MSLNQDDPPKVGNRLRQVRSAAHLTQDELADPRRH